MASEAHKIVFYDDGQAMSNQVDRDSRKTRPQDASVKEYYEVERTVNWILENGFERVIFCKWLRDSW